MAAGSCAVPDLVEPPLENVEPLSSGESTREIGDPRFAHGEPPVVTDSHGVRRASPGTVVQREWVRSLADGLAVRGSTAVLQRRNGGLAIRVRTRGLEPREAVDVFWAVFNQPSACENPNPLTDAPCSPADLFVAAAGGSLHFVATLTADERGRLAYAASLETGSGEGCVGDPFPCGTLTNPLGAEVHSPLFVPNGGPGRQAAQFIAPEPRGGR